MKTNLLPRSESERRPPAHKRTKIFFLWKVSKAKKCKEGTGKKTAEKIGKKRKPREVQNRQYEQKTVKEGDTPPRGTQHFAPL
jgi:hypothetical protein